MFDPPLPPHKAAAIHHMGFGVVDKVLVTVTHQQKTENHVQHIQQQQQQQQTLRHVAYSTPPVSPQSTLHTNPNTQGIIPSPTPAQEPPTSSTTSFAFLQPVDAAAGPPFAVHDSLGHELVGHESLAHDSVAHALHAAATDNKNSNNHSNNNNHYNNNNNNNNDSETIKDCKKPNTTVQTQPNGHATQPDTIPDTIPAVHHPTCIDSAPCTSLTTPTSDDSDGDVAGGIQRVSGIQHVHAWTDGVSSLHFGGHGFLQLDAGSGEAREIGNTGEIGETGERGKTGEVLMLTPRMQHVAQHETSAMVWVSGAHARAMEAVASDDQVAQDVRKVLLIFFFVCGGILVLFFCVVGCQRVLATKGVVGHMLVYTCVY